jgi:hypothetical protein
MRRKKLTRTALALAGFVAATAGRAAFADASGCWTAAERAQELERASKLDDAREQLRVCVERSCHPEVRHDCEAFLAHLDEVQPSVIVRAKETRGHDVFGVRVLVDGRERRGELNGSALPVDPGVHVFRYEARSGAAVEDTLVISLKEQNRPLDVHFDAPLRGDGTIEAAAFTAAPAAKHRPLRPATVVAAGLGVAALGSFVGFEIAGQSALHHVQEGCGGTMSCTESDVDPARAKFVAAGVSLGAAAALFAVAGLLHLTTPPVAER